MSVDPLGAAQIGDLHIDIRDPALLPAEMLEDLHGKAAVVLDEFGIDHGRSPFDRPDVRTWCFVDGREDAAAETASLGSDRIDTKRASPGSAGSTRRMWIGSPPFVHSLAAPCIAAYGPHGRP